MSKDGERHLHAVHEDWSAVAAALNARMSNHRLSQAELALAAGVSVATVRFLQRGDGGRRAQNATLAAVSRALGWPDDHLVRVLLGEHYPWPVEAPAARDVLGAASPQVSLVKAPGDVSTQILMTLRRIERRVDDIADYLTGT